MTSVAYTIGKPGRQVEMVFEFTQQYGSEIAGDLRFVETDFDPTLIQGIELQALGVFESDIIHLVELKIQFNTLKEKYLQ